MDSIELSYKIRLDVLNMIHNAKASHIASAYSIADIISVLYNDVLIKFPQDPKNKNRDRFILSKGHAGAAIYAALAETGYFDRNLLKTYYKNNSIFSGHISHKNVPGVEFSTGSLGHGVCVACGMALAAKINNQKHHIYALIGDGESEEGCVFETAIFANKQHLDNFTIIIDNNGYQALGKCEDELEFSELSTKWKSFGFNVTECDGHNHPQIKKSLLNVKNGKPNCVICHTTKGKGVSFMENNNIWHYKDPQGEVFNNALSELENNYEKYRNKSFI